MNADFLSRSQVALGNALIADVLPWLGVAAGVLILWACLRVYGRLLGRTVSGRGHVRAAPLGLPDLVAVASLFAWLGATVFSAWVHASQRAPLTNEGIVEGALLFAVLDIGIAFFLRARGLSVIRLFGLRPARPLAVLATGAGLFLAVLPLVWASFMVVQGVGGGEMQPQEITRYFTEAVERREWGRILLAGGMAAFAAPLTEEFLFRGYFYGTLRRHLGALPALLLVSVLFASIHMNGGTLLPLFVLAACLTLAYEATGSLWTPICIHALFNTLMLGVMFYSARNS